jgi:hypothetical protein
MAKKIKEAKKQQTTERKQSDDAEPAGEQSAVVKTKLENDKKIKK